MRHHSREEHQRFITQRPWAGKGECIERAVTCPWTTQGKEESEHRSQRYYIHDIMGCESVKEIPERSMSKNIREPC